MWNWQAVTATMLALLGLGVMFGQDFHFNVWVGLCWVGAAVLFIVRFIHREPTALDHFGEGGNVTNSDKTKEWAKLSKRFEQLREQGIAAANRRHDRRALTHAEREDEAGHGWRIGSSDADCRRDAEVLCGHAGALLLVSRVKATLPDSVKSMSDPRDRWLFFLKELGETDAGGDMRIHSMTIIEGVERNFYWDEISDLAKSSTRGCTECITREIKQSS